MPFSIISLMASFIKECCSPPPYAPNFDVYSPYVCVWTLVHALHVVSLSFFMVIMKVKENNISGITFCTKCQQLEMICLACSLLIQYFQKNFKGDPNSGLL